MHSLLFANIPYDCDETQVRNWLEARGVDIRRIRLIPDIISGTSPSFARVRLVNADGTERVARLLDGQILHNQVLRVKALKLMDTSKPLHGLKVSA